ncbi:MAG: hypothetical protein KHW65_10445, partial [Clostridiales bacterium]|nr:hypothetical protein [Clostridiales bacterium]
PALLCHVRSDGTMERCSSLMVSESTLKPAHSRLFCLFCLKLVGISEQSAKNNGSCGLPLKDFGAF